MKNSDYYSSTQECLDEVRLGNPIIILDDRDRENEGDLFIPGEKITTEIMTLMIKNSSGIICLTMSQSESKRLNLAPLRRRNTINISPMFTDPIEAKHNITTGVSAHDRVTTIKTAILGDECDIVTPGHVMTITAHKDGLKERRGHTEASITMARLAGFKPYGVICELMNEDGTVSKLSQILKFANKFSIKLITIEDIIDYIKKNELNFENH